MKRLLIVLMLFVEVLSISSQTISIEKALQNSQEFLSSVNKDKQVKGVAAIPTHSLHLEYTATDQDDTPDFYVFNHRDGGFVIAGGDNVSLPILAYSETGSFDYDSIPAGFRYWLQEYQRQIEYAKDKGRLSSTAVSRGTDASDGKEEIEPLISSRWDQDSPFNSMCPTIGSRTAMTGCVATAMSQIMKFHQWPVQGNGSHTYYDTSSRQTLTSDFSTHTYDWSNMSDQYSSTSQSAQQKAVAQLMYDCGVSVEMQYSTSGSGAWTENVTYALVNYFGYDQGARQIMHDYVTDDEWEAYIYDELSHQRPIIFSGADSLGDLGHCFVCDGYSKAIDKYHFNWGWGGDYDCYCALSAIKVIGMEFDFMQDIIIGIQPPTEDPQLPVAIFAYDGDMQITISDSAESPTYNVRYCYVEYPDTVFNQIYNHSYRDVDVMFALKYTNMQTGEDYITSSRDSDANTYHFPTIYPMDDEYTLHGVTEITIKDVILPDMPAGSYRVVLVAKDCLDKDTDNDSMWHEVKTYIECKNYVTIEHVPVSISRPEEPRAHPQPTDENQTTYNLAGQIIKPKTNHLYIHKGRISLN